MQIQTYINFCTYTCTFKTYSLFYENKYVNSLYILPVCTESGVRFMFISKVGKIYSFKLLNTSFWH